MATIVKQNKYLSPEQVTSFNALLRKGAEYSGKVSPEGKGFKVHMVHKGKQLEIDAAGRVNGQASDEFIRNAFNDERNEEG